MINRYYIYLLLSNLLIGSVGTIVKLINTDNIPRTTVVFYRILFSAIIVFIICLFRDRKNLKVKKETLSVNFLIGFVYLLAIATYTIANVLAPVSNVALLSQFVPIVVLIIVFFAWKEKPTRRDVIALVLSLIALFIMNPMELSNNIGNVIAFLNSILVGLFVVLLKKYSLDNHLSFIFKYMFVSVLMLFPFVLYYGFGEFTAIDLILFIILGFVTGIAGVFRFIALKHIKAGRFAIITSIATPLFAVLFGILIINESLSTNVIIGGIVLIIAIVFMNLQKRKITL